MTIARDKVTGQIVGQVLAHGPRFEEIGGTVRLLTRDGVVIWPKYQVRLEEISDR